MGFDRKAHAAREAEILIQAANERRELNKMKLPDEPIIKEKPVRIDNNGLQASINSLLGRYSQKIQEEERTAPKENEAWKREPSKSRPTAGASHDYRA